MNFLCSFRLALIYITIMLSGSPVLAALVEHHGTIVEDESDHTICLSCHDGTMGKDIEYCKQDCSSHSIHSVGKNYPPRGMQSEYAPAAWLSKSGIRLVDNKISCISCHNLLNQEKYHLAVTNDLCISCHYRK